MIRRLFTHFLFVCFLVYFVLCMVIEPEDKVIASLGEYETREFFTDGGFQDYVGYAKYHFPAANVEENKYLDKIDTTDFTAINAILDDFESWIEVISRSNPTNEVVVNYSFDRAIVDAKDYFYIAAEMDTWDDGTIVFLCYDVYIFDIQTQILYYFHCNT